MHFQPLSALLFTFVLLGVGFYLGDYCDGKWSRIGSLLVGVSGSWLGGCLFWGWLRMHPVLHLPVEAVATPLALIGITTKWRIGASFYLACLLGTAFTDFMMVLTGVMGKWPEVVNASFDNASKALNETALNLLHPWPIFLLLIAAVFIFLISDQMRQRGNIVMSLEGATWLVASAALTTTLWVDGLFLLTTLLQPKLSGLI
ncbi:Permeases of the major facilitator [Prochlorococcus sp. MIT 0601]|nr:Permeases of the major facilitator [Prochlorococcus sp. MIT 0601]